MYQVIRDEDGWHLFSHDLTFASLMRSYATRRQALTAVQMMREAEELACALMHHCESDDA